MSNDARTVTRFLSIGGSVVMALAAALLAWALEHGSTNGTAWAVLLMFVGSLGAGVGVVVLGVTLADSRDDARR